MRLTDGDFERFLDEIATTGNEADASDCYCPACLAARLDDLLETQRRLQADVDRMLETLGLIVQRLDAK